MSPGADDNVMLGIDGGSSGFEGGGSGSSLWLTLGFVNFRTAHRCYRPLRWMAKGRVVGSKLMIRLIGRVVATVKVVGVPALPLRYGAIEYTVSVPVAPQNRDFICY